MSTVGASDDINQEYPKVESPRYHPIQQKVNRVLAGLPIEVKTKSGTKTIRIRRCNRTLSLTNDFSIQCQREQHDADRDPAHTHRVIVHSRDGSAKDVLITWTDLGPVSHVILMRPLVRGKPDVG